MEPYNYEIHRYMAGREEMEPTFELHRSVTLSLNALFRVWSTNHKPAAHCPRHGSGGREFIDGEHDCHGIGHKVYNFLDERRM